MANGKLKFLFCWIVVFYQLTFADILIKEVRVKGNWYTRTEVILKLSPIKTGKMIPEDKLEQKIKETEKVLRNTNYFYNVLVYRLFSKNPHEATIMIEVSEGFLWRFGGGPIYVMIGKENIKGQALSCFVSMGLNLQAIELEKRFLLSQFGAGFQGLHEFYYFAGERTEEGRLGFKFFYDFNPYLRFTLIPGYSYTYFKEEEYRILWLGMDIRLKNYDDDFYASKGYELYLSTKAAKDYWCVGHLTSIFHQLPLKFKGNFKLNFGLVSDDAPYFEYFSILGPDRLKLFKFTDSIGQCYSVFTYKIRKKLMDIPLFLFPGFFDLLFFTDVGYLDKWHAMSIDYGMGAGLHFPAPVFVHIHFFGAMDTKKEKKLYFTITSQI